VTNVPGPQIPLYVLGRQLEDLFPLAFLPKNHALAVAIMSYNGGLDYGLLGDYDALPDIDVIAEGIDASLKELLDEVPRALARKTSGDGEARQSSGDGEARNSSGNGEAPKSSGNGEARGPGTAQILPSGTARPKRGPAADMRAKRAKQPERAPGDSAG
jgi:hypothetical protein